MKVSRCFLWVVWKYGKIPFSKCEYCCALFQAMVAMDLEGKIRRPRTEFDDERVRYEHRFAALGQVSTPPLVPYVQFKEMTKVGNQHMKERLYALDERQKIIISNCF